MEVCRRIVVVGPNGAGKTWLAGQLARRSGLPVVHKDALALRRAWQQRSREQVQAMIVRLASEDDWILEGGPSVLVPAVLDRADLVVWLDLPAGLRFGRVVWRSLYYAGRVRPEHPAGNRDWPGLRQWRFAWRALRQGDAFRRVIEAALEGAVVPVVRLRSPAEVMRFLS